MLVWNVLPPCLATVCAIAFVATVSSADGGRRSSSSAGSSSSSCSGAAAAGRPLHHEFADRAAAVDGEMTDVVGNMAIVKAFGGLLARAPALRCHGRAGDGRAPAQPALSRAAAHHACARHGGADDRRCWPGPSCCGSSSAATTGDVILVCTLGLSVLHATRDLAVALVDVTQHMARFAEALSTLLVPHQLCDRPGAPRPGAPRRQRDVRGRHVRLSRLPHDFRGPELPHRHRPARRSGRRLRRRQVHPLRPAAALLRHPIAAAS